MLSAHTVSPPMFVFVCLCFGVVQAKEVCDSLVCGMKQLELSILNKLQVLQTMLHASMACEATEERMLLPCRFVRLFVVLISTNDGLQEQSHRS